MEQHLWRTAVFPSFDPIHVVAPAIWIGLLALVVAISVSTYKLCVAGHDVPPEHEGAETSRRHCCYCRRGAAVLREESVRFDGDDVVDVRCYVCTGCGLPQWWVGRRHLAPRVR
jgi:hypothetical protein